MAKVVVGLSGGLDSSFSLYLLKKQGFQPIGVSLKFGTWRNKKNLCRENLCCTQESFELARKSCQKLGVPYYIIDCQKEFKETVISYFVKELKAGRTPNPCVVCNYKLKFPKLFQLAKKFGASYISTGHYAQIRPFESFACDSCVSNRFLLQANDKTKDQTYFLYTLSQKQLAKLIFPLGQLNKKDVRKMADQEKINYTKKESQNFCFVDNCSMFDFLKSEIGLKNGPIYNTSGKLLGTHSGLHFYTIGQHKGLSFGKRYWVAQLNKKRNALIITDNPKDPALLKKEVVIQNVNWISGQKPKLPIKIMAKVRYRQEAAIGMINYNQKSKVYSLKFKIPQRAITPGQSCVFYSSTKASARADKNSVCLGGGIIK